MQMPCALQGADRRDLLCLCLWLHTDTGRPRLGGGRAFLCSMEGSGLGTRPTMSASANVCAGSAAGGALSFSFGLH